MAATSNSRTLCLSTALSHSYPRAACLYAFRMHTADCFHFLKRNGVARLTYRSACSSTVSILETLRAPRVAVVEHNSIRSVRQTLLDSLQEVPHGFRRRPLCAFDELLFAREAPLAFASDLQTLEPPLFEVLMDVHRTKAVLVTLTDALNRALDALALAQDVASTAGEEMHVQCHKVNDRMLKIEWVNPHDERCRAAFSIRPDRLEWLKERYHRVCQQRGVAPLEAHFLVRTFNVLARYDAIGGAGHQSAVPRDIIGILGRRFEGKCHELFASPLNTALSYADSHYCSAFYDTDQWFGSRGRFNGDAGLESIIQESQGRQSGPLGTTMSKCLGCAFVVNPPFSDATISAAVQLLRKALSSHATSPLPLAFLVVVPANEGKDNALWRDLCSLPSCRARLVLPPGAAAFLPGFQHREYRAFRPADFSAGLALLQNHSADLLWPDADRTLNEVVEVFLRPIVDPPNPSRGRKAGGNRSRVVSRGKSVGRGIPQV